MLQAGRLRVRVPMSWIFQFKRQYGPGVDSTSNKNEYQQSSWWIKDGRRVRLTTLPLSMSQLSRICGGLHGLLSNFWRAVQIKEYHIIQLSLASCCSLLLSYTLPLRVSPLPALKQVSHNTATCNVMVLSILIPMSSGSRSKDKSL
jgi:hypothetical protein